MKSITLNAIIEGIRARKDRSLGLSISTSELPIDLKALFMELQGINVRLHVEPLDNPIEDNVVVDTEVNKKSQSQRIRSVLFILWKQDSKGLEFAEYYRQQTEKYIEWLKSKLED